MPIYGLNDSGIERLQKTTFADQGIRERQDIQRLLRDPIRNHFGKDDGDRRGVWRLGRQPQAGAICFVSIKRPTWLCTASRVSPVRLHHWLSFTHFRDIRPLESVLSPC